jgi:isopenicillin N synthase-like dioxygenase
MNALINDLETKGFMALSYSADLREAVKKTALSWQKFCSLPVKVKKAFPYSNNKDGVGYELKEGEGNKGDLKENFDVSTTDKNWLDAHVQNIKDPVVLEFVRDATNLTRLFDSALLDFARQAEEKYGLKGFVDKVKNGKIIPFVRCIHYPSLKPGQIGIETASAHVDQSAFTFHLWEKGKGVQCLTYADKQWIDMPVSEGEAIAFPAMQLQLWSKGKLRGLYHRVISTPQTVKDGRWSMVVFFQDKDLPKYDKDTQGCLQEKEVGFNYQMSEGDFSKLFKK